MWSWPPALLLGAVLIVFLGLVSLVRVLRRSRQRLPDPPLNVDFSLADLHEMLRTGQLTPDEFERARLVVLRNASRRAAEADHEQGHAFEVIQNPPAPPPLPVESPPPPPAGDDVDDDAGGAGSRDAR